MERRIHNTRGEGSGVRGQTKTAGRSLARTGFTLAESLIASVVLASAVVGIAGTLAASHQQTNVLEQRTQAVSLARQLLEEIIARPFNDPQGVVSAPGPETGETASNGSAVNFDNIDDYHGYSDISTPSTLSPVPAGTIEAANATTATSSATYTRNVSIEYRAAIDGAPVSSGPFALVTVQVTTPANSVVSVSQLTCDYKRGQ